VLEKIRLLERNSLREGITHFGIDDPRQGIVHVIGPELGLTQPGLTITCGDSHTSTHGAFGAFAFGIGASQLQQVLATQCLWQKRPKVFRIAIEGGVPEGVTAKDIILTIIARIGTAGATGHILEYSGSAIARLSMDARMTICNMSIEAGARAGMIAPDAVTFDYLRGRPFAPPAEHWEKAVASWRSLRSDDGAVFDRELTIPAAELEPMVSWGTSPEDAIPITARVPDPQRIANADKRKQAEAALAYMDLPAGARMEEIAIDYAFIGTCTNGRIEDLRAAAQVLKGRKVVVPAWVSPGSMSVKAQAEAEGLDRIFKEAGFDWRSSGCSGCAAMNGDVIPPGKRCASTSNRNFEGRQGKGSRTHLMGPAMVAAAAVTGRLTDVRRLLGASGSP
jgi:3-isopropylmalate/(R)-2-methylmalate dehydratase large subunit